MKNQPAHSWIWQEAGARGDALFFVKPITVSQTKLKFFHRLPPN